jgi:hypothetical protein
MSRTEPPPSPIAASRTIELGAEDAPRLRRIFGEDPSTGTCRSSNATT